MPKFYYCLGCSKCNTYIEYLLWLSMHSSKEDYWDLMVVHQIKSAQIYSLEYTSILILQHFKKKKKL